MEMKTYPQIKAENEKLRERLREAISALKHGNIPAWLLEAHLEASKELLELVDVMLRATENDKRHDLGRWIGERNKLAEKLGLDKRDG